MSSAFFPTTGSKFGLWVNSFRSQAKKAFCRILKSAKKMGFEIFKEFLADGQGDQVSLRKIRPKCSPTHFFAKICP
jgi:hypothetical protein